MGKIRSQLGQSHLSNMVQMGSLLDSPLVRVSPSDSPIYPTWYRWESIGQFHMSYVVQWDRTDSGMCLWPHIDYSGSPSGSPTYPTCTWTDGKYIGCPQLSYGHGGQSFVDTVFRWQTWTCVDHCPLFICEQCTCTYPQFDFTARKFIFILPSLSVNVCICNHHDRKA